MDNKKHLQWCKDRAMQYIDRNQVADGITSFMSDMTKHPETEHHPALILMRMMMFTGKLKTSKEAAKFIQGFN